MYDWTEECEIYCNHHEIFHIAQDDLKKEDISNALEDILGENGWAMDGKLEKDGAFFSTAKEDIYNLTKSLSEHFPNATCFGQDAWDCEGYIICFENGLPSTNYNASFSHCELDKDLYENDDDYYDCELIIKAENGYSFDAGGGFVYYKEVDNMKDFIKNGSLSL